MNIIVDTLKNKIIVTLILFFSFSAYAITQQTEGIASWYGNESIVPKWGGYTANGEKFDENKLTCAVPKREMMNKWYLVTNIENGKSVKVWANDLGNFAKYGRIIDLSKRAFSLICNLEKGLVRVKVVEVQ